MSLCLQSEHPDIMTLRQWGKPDIFLVLMSTITLAAKAIVSLCLYVASVNQYFRKKLMWVTDVSTESIETWEWNKEVPWSFDTSWLAVIILQSYSISLFPFSSILLMFVTSCQELWGLLMVKSVKFSWFKNFHSQKKSASTQLPYDRVRTKPGIVFLTRLNLYS